MKTLKITDKLHKRIKVYCALNNKRIGSLVEHILDREVEKLEKESGKEKMDKKVS